MPLSTSQYGFIIDPMVPFTDASGTTIRNGYVRVFVAGSSTPVITYKNYDGATNEETIQLDNSGRTAYPVIVSKGNTYKVCVYDAEHSQESPILTIDKVVPAGANVEATNIVTGLDNVESPEAGWVKSTVSGTDAEVSLDATNVTSEVDTMVKATAASADYMMPLVHKTGSDPDKKITLGNIFKFVLDNIVNLATTITSFASGDYFVVGRSAGAVKMSKDDLLTNTAQNALAGNVAQAFDPTRDAEHKYLAGESVVYEGKTYTFKVDHYGAWAAADVQLTDEFWRTSFSRDQYQDGYIPNNSTYIGDLTANGDRISIKIGCVVGQKFLVRGISSGYAARLWCTFDDYGRIKRRAAAGLDTRTAPLTITIEEGETGIAFNVFKAQTYFVACVLPNFAEKISTKVSGLEFRSIENSVNTAIPFKKLYAGKYLTAAGIIAGDDAFDVYEYDVNQGTKIHIKTATGGGYIAFYDVDGVLVGSPFKEPNSLNDERVFYDVSVPATAVIIRVTIYKSWNGVTQVPSVISNDGFGIGKVVELTKHIFAGKKILCIGDSITESGTWFDTLLEKTGAALIWNRGASGSTLASYTGSTDSMCDRADLDADNDASHHSGGFPSDANVDVVIVWGGTNDFGNATKNVQFGTIVKRDKMYFLDGVFYLVDKLKAKYPTKPIYVCGIMTAQKGGTGDWNRYTVSSGVFTERTNWTGKTVTEYNEAIKQICSMTGVHYIDMEQCGISPVNSGDRSNYFNADGLHPTSAGGVRIGKYIAESLIFDS